MAAIPTNGHQKSLWHRGTLPALACMAWLICCQAAYADSPNAELEAYRNAARNLPIVKKTGQKICRTIDLANQWRIHLANGQIYVPGGQHSRAQYLITAFTESAEEYQIQLRIAAIQVNLPTGFALVDRIEGDAVPQGINSSVWDDPIRWQPCD